LSSKKEALKGQHRGFFTRQESEEAKMEKLRANLPIEYLTGFSRTLAEERRNEQLKQYLDLKKVLIRTKNMVQNEDSRSPSPDKASVKIR